jgi:pimeloyl-ACP methyl ester carboxylesterase
VATLKRPGGAEIHWDRRGDAGPVVYLVPLPMLAMPSNFEGLIADLARDHRVVTWDPRGIGGSSPTGPYDLATDAEDLAALIAESGAPGTLVSPGRSPASLVVADTHPDLVAAVVLLGGVPRLERPVSGDPGVLTDSDAVTEATLQMVKTDPRGLLRTWIQLGNPQLSDAALRARLEAQLAYCPQEAAIPRVESYLIHDSGRVCAALGERLWIVHWKSPISMGQAVTHVKALLPEAHVVDADDGPISRPDLSAAVVRDATADIRSVP